MFQSLVTKCVYAVVLCGGLLSTVLVEEAAALNATAFAGNYLTIVPELSGITYAGSADGLTATVKVAKSGKISGRWTTSTDGITETGSVTVKGTISKITKGKIKSTAKFTFTLSDGAKGSGTLSSFQGGAAAITGSLSKAGQKVSFAGSRSL
jgi:hypothetical protein